MPRGVRFLQSMIEIEEDQNPEPMVNRKPVEKKSTAGDKFEEHQNEYESRGKTKDRMKQVHDHNSGYPKLRDELDKRRSLTKITTNTRNRSNSTPQNRSRRAQTSRRKQRNPKRSRVTKNRRKDRTKLRKALKYSRRPSLCDYCRYLGLGKELRIVASRMNVASKSALERSESHHTSDTMSNLSRKYPPDPSEPSVSSYHSFYSTDHEVMV